MTVHRKRWPWILLFVSVMVIIAVLMTSWNWVLVQHYNRMILLAKDQWTSRSQEAPWLSAILGTLGFSTLIVLFALFFAKILREMKLNQLQRDFLANMTHELKTPLASLELSASLLKKGTALPDDDRSTLWQTHDTELRRLREEIERLLTASRWEQFHDKPDFADVDLEAWLHKSMEKWKRMLPMDAKLVRIGDPLVGVATLDVSLLALITGNLIDNARKFSGSRPLTMSIRTRVLDDAWDLSFKDDGLGFAPDEATKIFNRFQRLKHRSDHAIPGTGLGLHLAKSASQAMNLELRAASAGPDKGARFVLSGRFKKKETAR
ncbi:MAG: HAMP domain-containing sensor histidine kinase [Bdellovibrionota bacterium]